MCSPFNRLFVDVLKSGSEKLNVHPTTQDDRLLISRKAHRVDVPKKRTSTGANALCTILADNRIFGLPM